jgi:hypothetical protein
MGREREHPAVQDAIFKGSLVPREKYEELREKLAGVEERIQFYRSRIHEIQREPVIERALSEQNQTLLGRQESEIEELRRQIGLLQR